MTLPDPIDKLISSRLGLNYKTLGKEGLKNLVNKRKAACAITQDHDYFDYLMSHPSEFEIFKEGLLVPETWFFRDSTPFDFLTDWASKKKASNEIINISSIPCATGEEPYSISIALIDADWKPENIKIYASDISTSFVATAKKGIYSKKSFRNQDPVSLNSFFDQLDDHYFSVKELYRTPIQFQVNNIASPNLFNNDLLFDVIFARNVLIYFTDEGKKNAINNIEKLLAPNGLLILGHADNITSLTNNFKKTGPPGAFAYEKTLTTPALKNIIHSKNTTAKARPEEQKLSKLLIDSKKYADQGLFNNATDACLRDIQLHGPSAQAYFIMGQIFTAQNKLTQAEDAYKKALQIDINHQETLFQYELLCIRNGNSEQAKKLRNRALSLTQK